MGFYLGYKEGIAQASRILNEAAQKQAESQVEESPILKSTDAVVVEKPLPLLPKATKAFVTGMSLVDRKEFQYEFDMGVPLFGRSEFNDQVLLLHAKSAMPANSSTTQINHLTVQEATKKCNYLSVVLTQPDRHDQCIAIMGQYNSYHVHKFMRAPTNKNPAKINASLLLSYV